MTDNDIVKGLECCGQNIMYEHCIDCPFNGELSRAICTIYLSRYALDLNNRQKAEIERLKTENKDISEQFRILDVECERLEKANEKQKAEIERLREHIELLDIEKEAIKISAIKEFAKKVKEEIAVWHFDFTYYSEILEACQRVDNIAKRMVGESK